MQNKFRTVRSVTTEATSLSLEVTSFTRTDVSSLAASGRDGVGIPSASRKRRKNTACGPSSRNTHRDKPSELQLNKGIVRPGDVPKGSARQAHPFQTSSMHSQTHGNPQPRGKLQDTTESRIGPCYLWTGDHSAVRLKSASSLLCKRNPDAHRAPIGEGIH